MLLQVTEKLSAKAVAASQSLLPQKGFQDEEVFFLVSTENSFHKLPWGSREWIIQITEQAWLSSVLFPVS